MRQRTAVALTLSLSIPGLAAASGSSAMSAPQQQMPTATPEQEAVEYYNDGISYRDKAAAYEKEAADILGLPSNVRQGVLIPTAYYTGETFRPAPRRPVQEVMHLNHW